MQDVKLTKKSFPKLHQAKVELWLDQGIGLEAARRAPMPSREILTSNEAGKPINLVKVEAFLARLSADELTTFCAGDQDDMVAISKLYPDGEMAHIVLDNMFVAFVI